MYDTAMRYKLVTVKNNFMVHRFIVGHNQALKVRA